MLQSIFHEAFVAKINLLSVSGRKTFIGLSIINKEKKLSIVIFMYAAPLGKIFNIIAGDKQSLWVIAAHVCFPSPVKQARADPRPGKH